MIVHYRIVEGPSGEMLDNLLKPDGQWSRERIPFFLSQDHGWADTLGLVSVHRIRIYEITKLSDNFWEIRGDSPFDLGQVMIEYNPERRNGWVKL